MNIKFNTFYTSSNCCRREPISSWFASFCSSNSRIRSFSSTISLISCSISISLSKDTNMYCQLIVTTTTNSLSKIYTYVSMHYVLLDQVIVTITTDVNKQDTLTDKTRTIHPHVYTCTCTVYGFAHSHTLWVPIYLCGCGHIPFIYLWKRRIFIDKRIKILTTKSS